MKTLVELFEYIIHTRKFFLIPVILILVVIGGLFVIAEGSIFSPFIYTIF